jgi:hypothetical protein
MNEYIQQSNDPQNNFDIQFELNMDHTKRR